MLSLFDSSTPAETASATPSTVAKRYGTWGVDLDGMDRSVKPGDDFFRYVNGKWAASTQIPPDKTRFGAFDLLRDLSELRVRAIVDGIVERNQPVYGVNTGFGKLSDITIPPARLAELVHACQTPKSAADVLPLLFRRPLTERETRIAMGEAMAHHAA